jgi:hypothetical protein
MNNARQTPLTQQLELTFEGRTRFEPPIRARGRAPRAQWWFAQIHKRIREAVLPPRPARPAQAHLALGGAQRRDWVTGTWLSAPLAGSRS